MEVKRVSKVEVKVGSMTLENYIKWYNDTLYPLNYPYKLRAGVRANGEKISLIISIGVPKDMTDVELPTQYQFVDIMEIKGESDKEVIDTFQRITLLDDLKANFKTVWDK